VLAYNEWCPHRSFVDGLLMSCSRHMSDKHVNWSELRGVDCGQRFLPKPKSRMQCPSDLLSLHHLSQVWHVICTSASADGWSVPPPRPLARAAVVLYILYMPDGWSPRSLLEPAT